MRNGEEPPFRRPGISANEQRVRNLQKRRPHNIDGPTYPAVMDYLTHPVPRGVIVVAAAMLLAMWHVKHPEQRQNNGLFHLVGLGILGGFLSIGWLNHVLSFLYICVGWVLAILTPLALQHGWLYAVETIVSLKDAVDKMVVLTGGPLPMLVIPAGFWFGNYIRTRIWIDLV
jgi:hypothetical protein